jgi:hypothetical protein
MKKYLLLIAIIAFSLNNSFAQWTNSGPETCSGEIVKNNNRLYLLSTRLYYSDDNGLNWQVENTPAVSFIDLLFLTGKIIAATDKGLFVSYDNGLNWFSHNTGITDSINGVRDLEINSNRLIATTSSAIYYSDNFGLSWTASNTAGSNFRKIAVNSGSIIITSTTGILKSDDNGLTFNISNSGINGTNILRAINVAGTFYCTKNNSIEIYRSTDNGASWQLSNSGISGTYNSSFSALSYVNGKVFFSSTTNLFELNLATGIWVLSAINSSNPIRILEYNSNSYFGRIYNMYEQILKSDSLGLNWFETGKGAYLSSVTKLFVSNTNLFAAVNFNGLYKLNSSDSSWIRFTPLNYNFGGSITNGSVGEVYNIVYGAGNKYYVGTDGGVWSSNDNGVTWVQSHVGLPITNTPAGYKTVKDLYINGNSIIAATTGGIYRSTDQANTWTQVSTLACNDLQKYGSYLYATGNGVFRSNDNGLTWTAFAGATSGGPFLYITGAGGKIFTSPQASGPTSLTNYADTSATSFTVMTSNIGDAYGYGDYLFTGSKYINTAISLSSFSDMSDNLPCYYGSVALGCYEPYANTNTVFGDYLWLGTTGFSTWYRSLADFGFPVGLNNSQTEKLEIKPYPNPANEIIYFKNLTKADQIEIFNNLGQLQRITLNEVKNGIDISNLAKGFYIYAITDEQNRTKSTGKFIKD